MLILTDNQSHGLVVTGNRFENGLSRFLAGGRNWLFTDNTVIDSLSHSFFMNLRPERFGRAGFECVPPRNIEISGNRFRTQAKTLFRFGGGPRNSGTAPTASHIRICGNVIEITGSSNLPLIDIDNVEYLTITGNRVDAARQQEGPFIRQHGGNRISIHGNRVSGKLRK